MPDHVRCINFGNGILTFVLGDEIQPVRQDECPHCSGGEFKEITE